MEKINLKEAEDFELMNLLSENDLGAWTELVNRYSTLVYAISFQILKNVNDTEDAVQNTFINLKIYGGKFDKSQELKPWLARIASVESIRIYNKKKYIVKKESARMASKNPTSQSQKREAFEIVEQKEIESLVKKAIDLLPEPTRVAITLYYAGEMNQTEIAKELDVSQEVISRKIKAGLEAIKNYLKNAGVHAAIALSPSLVQQSLIYTKPSPDFIHKLINQLPSKEEMARISTNNSIGYHAIENSKRSSWYVYWGLGSLLLFLLGFLFIPKFDQYFSSEKIEQTTKDKQLNDSKPESKFIPVDFKDNQPIYFRMGKVQANNSPERATSGPIFHFGGEPNWIIQDNNIKRIKYLKNSMDGIYNNSKFKSACIFKGTIFIDSENDRTGLVMNTPIDKSEGRKVVIGNESNSYSVAESISQLYDFNTFKKLEVEFYIFVWPHKNSWKWINFFKPIGDSEKWQFKANSVKLYKQEFHLGIYSTGKTEFKNFQYSMPDSQWSPQLEPMINKVLKDIPSDFFNEE